MRGLKNTPEKDAWESFFCTLHWQILRGIHYAKYYCGGVTRIFLGNKTGVRIRFLPDSDPRLCTSNEDRFKKFYCMNILDNFKIIIFCFHNFSVK